MIVKESNIQIKGGKREFKADSAWKKKLKTIYSALVYFFIEQCKLFLKECELNHNLFYRKIV